jgi:selenium-binding protein 1
MAMKAAPETLAYVAAFDPNRKRPDAIAVVDVNPKSKSYSQIIGSTAMPNAGDELHHFGWNACSSCLCPNAPHAHAERRYLVVPGLRSSRIHILDTKPDPKKPKIVKVIEPQEVADKAGYTRPHTVHCGPEGIYVAALGNREGKGPGGNRRHGFGFLGKSEPGRQMVRRGADPRPKNVRTPYHESWPSRAHCPCRPLPHAMDPSR